MPIINNNRLNKKEKIKTEISSEILAKIQAYCSWANIDDIGFFIEEAATFVFSKDKEWKKREKSAKRRVEKVIA